MRILIALGERGDVDLVAADFAGQRREVFGGGDDADGGGGAAVPPPRAPR